MPQTAEELRTTDAIVTDRWDRQDLETLHDDFPKLGDLAEKLRKVNEVANDVIDDLALSCLKYDPTPTARDEMAHSHVINSHILKEMYETDSWQELRQHTVQDPLLSAMATVTLSERLPELYDKLKNVQEAANRAQAAQDRLDELAEAAGDPGGRFADDADVTAARQAVADAVEALEAQLDAAGPQIGRAVRSGLEQAVEEAADMVESARGWGLEPGAATRMDPTERLELAQQMRSTDMRKIAELLGRMCNLTLSLKAEKFVQEPGEIVDITLGDDLAWLVPDELVALCDDDLFDDFLVRLADGRVSVFKVERVEKEAKGPVIGIFDSSGSMSGRRLTHAKAFGLALLSIAADQKRPCYLMDFSGLGDLAEFAFPRPARRDPKMMLEFASHSFGGGTEPQQALDRAMEIITADPEFAKADVVIVTDGDFYVDPAWKKRFLAAQEQLGFQVLGCEIDHTGTKDFRDVCSGKTFNIEDLESGADVAGVFAAVRS